MDDCSGIHSDTSREILEEFNDDDVGLINAITVAIITLKNRAL